MNQKDRIKLNLYLSKDLADLTGKEIDILTDLLIKRLGEALRWKSAHSTKEILIPLATDALELSVFEINKQN